MLCRTLAVLAFLSVAYPIEAAAAQSLPEKVKCIAAYYHARHARQEFFEGPQPKPGKFRNLRTISVNTGRFVNLTWAVYHGYESCRRSE
jgi:hypothetical protein